MKLKDSFLNRLKAGEHEVKVYLESGSADERHKGELSACAKLMVKNAPEKKEDKISYYAIPETGVE